MTNTVTFDAPKTQRLRKAYERAKAAGSDTFQFDDNEYLVAYAKYLLEYLEGKFQ